MIEALKIAGACVVFAVVIVYGIIAWIKDKDQAEKGNPHD